MNNRVEGYDVIRSVAILLVFLAHILSKQATNGAVLLTFSSLSPGLTMSLLAFISASLLSAKEHDPGSFLIKRFTRIYIPLLLCLFVVLSAHAFVGKDIVSRHVALHAMGLSAFFQIFQVENKATIGGGLWFITVINLMYLVLPLFRKLFRHPRGLFHLALFVVLCSALSFGSSMSNVVISFAVGVYLGANGQTSLITNARTIFSFAGCLGLLTVVFLSTAGIIPYATRGLLFAFYPLVFVPLLFAVSTKLPPPILAASGLFASLSYEFYILHFYFINEGFADFFPASTSLSLQILVSFITTLLVAYLVSKVASWFRKLADSYLLGI